MSALMTRVKQFIGPIIANDTTGRIAARLLGDRIPHRGLTIDTSPAIIQPRIKAALLLHGYESSEYRFVRDFLPRDVDVIELGGSLGVISCTIRRKLDPARRLVVVEADPRLAQALEHNLAINRCEANVTVEQVAIAYGGAQSVRFTLGETSVSGRVGEAGGTDRTIEVPAITLAGLIARHGIDRFALVSDIEGVEWAMLEHDSEALRQAELIVMETHGGPGGQSHEVLIERLSALPGFRLIDRHGSVVVLARATPGGQA